MSRVMRKQTMWFSNRSDINLAVQSQKKARNFKFWIKKVEQLYYPFRKTKAVTAKLICVLFLHMQIVDFLMMWLIIVIAGDTD